MTQAGLRNSTILQNEGQASKIKLSTHAPWVTAQNWLCRSGRASTRLSNIVEGSLDSYKVDCLSGVVLRVVLDERGCKLLLFSDGTATLPVTVHASVFKTRPGVDQEGAALILQRVSVLEHLPGVRSLIICPSNVVRVVAADGGEGVGVFAPPHTTAGVGKGREEGAVNEVRFHDVPLFSQAQQVGGSQVGGSQHVGVSQASQGERERRPVAFVGRESSQQSQAGLVGVSQAPSQVVQGAEGKLSQSSQRRPVPFVQSSQTLSQPLSQAVPVFAGVSQGVAGVAGVSSEPSGAGAKRESPYPMSRSKRLKRGLSDAASTLHSAPSDVLASASEGVVLASGTSGGLSKDTAALGSGSGSGGVVLESSTPLPGASDAGDAETDLCDGLDF